MTDKDLQLIKRRFRGNGEYSNITHIYGCYVTSGGEIISTFDINTGTLSENSVLRYFELFKKTLSGGLGKKILKVDFPTMTVANKEGAYGVLDKLRESDLRDEDARMELYQEIISQAAIETNYLITMAAETFDIPRKRSDGDEYSEDSFHYFICAICPVKQSKEELCYQEGDKTFLNTSAGQSADAPIAGFMFPALDGFATNLYSATFYSKKGDSTINGILETVMGVTAPKSELEQKEAFGGILHENLGDDFDLSMMSRIREKIAEQQEAAKMNEGSDEPLTLNCTDVKNLLLECGAEPDAARSAEESFKMEFGDEGAVTPDAVLDMKKCTIKTDAATISFKQEDAALVSTRVIGGVKYILIRADEGMEMNGIALNISE